jgi:xanthine dehydrogenase accessory factor
MDADGAVVGSVSGCVEDDLVHHFVTTSWPIPGSGQPRCIPLCFGVSSEDARRYGLRCGGQLERICEVDRDLPALESLVDHLVAGHLVRRTVRLADGTASLEAATQPAAIQVDDVPLSQTFGPGYRMLLLGAGQLAEYLATMALFNGFAVTFCDPRSEYAGTWAVPGVRVVYDMPDDAVVAFRPDSRSAVIALYHDPKLDDLALIDALSTDAMYIGAIGSRRNSTARKLRLAEHFDIGEEALARLRGPIGLFIGSQMPSEIAVSVMAEVLAVKNGVPVDAARDVSAAKSLEVTREALSDNPH